jgi:DNA-binding NarL/FixJ family response regulator
MVLGRGVAEKVVGGLMGRNDAKQLNEQEMKVLLHIARGYENDEITDKLNIGMTAMIEVMANIMNKLEVRDRSAAALKALRTGLITLEDLHDLEPPAHE